MDWTVGKFTEASVHFVNGYLHKMRGRKQKSTAKQGANNKESKLNNISCQLGDAANLENIDDNSFDVVLCLGPMYHLPPSERETVIAECERVCKNGWLPAFAYINKTGYVFLFNPGRNQRNNPKARLNQNKKSRYRLFYNDEHITAQATAEKAAPVNGKQNAGTASDKTVCGLPAFSFFLPGTKLR